MKGQDQEGACREISGLPTHNHAALLFPGALSKNSEKNAITALSVPGHHAFVRGSGPDMEEHKGGLRAQPAHDSESQTRPPEADPFSICQGTQFLVDPETCV